VRVIVRFIGVWILLQFVIALTVRVIWPSILESRGLSTVAAGVVVTGISLLLTILDARSFRRRTLLNRQP
jgi:hypothetical protein